MGVLWQICLGFGLSAWGRDCRTRAHSELGTLCCGLRFRVWVFRGLGFRDLICCVVEGVVAIHEGSCLQKLKRLSPIRKH